MPWPNIIRQRTSEHGTEIILCWPWRMPLKEFDIPVEILLERTSFSFSGGYLFGESCVRDSGLCPLLLSAWVVHYAQTSAGPVFPATICMSSCVFILLFL